MLIAKAISADGNFAEYIARERERLRAEREQIFNQQEELHAEARCDKPRVCRHRGL